MDCSLPGSSVHEILQARILEWVAFPFSRGSSQPKDPNQVKVKSLSCVRLFATPWTVTYQAPLSMRFSRQEYWSGLPFPSPGDLPDPGIEPGSPALESDALTSEPPGKPKKKPYCKLIFRLEADSAGNRSEWKLCFLRDPVTSNSAVIT